MIGGFELTNWLAAAVVSAALNSLWLGLLVAALASVTVRLLPRPNAATRYAVWLTALGLVLGLPVLLLIPHPATAQVSLATHATAAPFTIPATVRWPLFAALLWLLVAAILLARVLWSLIHIQGLKRRATFLARPGQIRVLASPEVRMPMAAGFAHPAIVFPSDLLAELDPGEFEQVLCHEMAHLRRGDDWTQLIQEMARALFFFHPAVHWIGRRLAIEREMACDDWVVSSTGQARPYAACLAHLHELTRGRRDLGRAMALAPGASTGKRRQITARVEALLEPQRKVSPRSARSAWIAGCALASAALIVAARATPPVTVESLPLATLSMPLPNAPGAPAISPAPRAKVPARPHLLARAAGPQLPVSHAALDNYLLVRAWQVDLAPTYVVITVVYFKPPPPTVLHGI